MAQAINAAFNFIGDLVMLPFQGSPWMAMFAWSVLIALLAMLAFKFCSNPDAIARTRNRVFAYILEFRLFKDDVLGVFGIFGRVLVGTLAYMKHYLTPIAVMIVPIVLLLIQMSTWFDYRPLEPGETALLTVTLNPDADVLKTPVTLSPSEGIEVDTEALRIPAENQLVWRLKAVSPNSCEPLELEAAGETVGKVCCTGSGMKKLSSSRIKGGFLAQLAHPAEPALPDNTTISSIAIGYPRRELKIGNAGINWLVAVFVLSIVFGLALKPMFKVEL